MSGHKFYDTLTERWHTMPAAPVIERAKLPTVAEVLSTKTKQNLRIAEHADLWQAIVSTATATQMSTETDDAGI